MNDSLARHFVDERYRLPQRILCAGEIVAVDRRPDAPQRAAQAGTELAIVFAVLDTLSVRFDRGCMLGSHVIYYPQNPKS